MSRLTKSDRDALAFVGLYNSTTSPETLESYTNHIWTREELCDKIGITRVVFSRFYLQDYDSASGVARYCPLTVAIYIQNLLKKRGRNETLREYAEYVINQNRRCSNPKKYGGKSAPSKKADAILEVILDLTRGKPNAYKAFDVALRKVGVFLPPPKE